MIFQICNRIALGEIVPITLNNFSECMPFNIRGFILVFIWTFFQIGTLLLGCIWYVAIPNLEVSQLKTKNVMMFISNLFGFMDHQDN